MTFRSGRTRKVEHVTGAEGKLKAESALVGKSENVLLENLGVGESLM
jgi:hypothetical protein